MSTISKLHLICTDAETAAQACAGGVDWIQLRLKNVSYEHYKEVALQVQEVCKKHNATFIINDNVALAQEIGADGVHLGKEDLSPMEARKQLGNNFIIGCTSNTVEDITRLSDLDIDYLGLGPFRFTTTKEKLSPVLGLDGYHTIFEFLVEHNIDYPPIVGIGGVAEDDVPALLATGLHGIAVSGAITKAEDITAMASRFKEATNFITI